MPSQEFFFEHLSLEVAPPGEHHIQRRILPEAEDKDEPDALHSHRVVPQVIQGTRPGVKILHVEAKIEAEDAQEEEY